MPLGYYHPQHAYSGPMGGRGGKTGSASSGAGVTAEGLYSRVKNYVGTKVTGPNGGTFEVVKKSDGSVVIVMTVPGKAATKTTKATSATKTTVTKTSSNWITVAQTTLELIRTQGFLAGTKTGSAGGSTSGSTGGSTSGSTGGSTSGSTGGSTGTQAPSWASNPYLSEMMALVGKTLPSNVYPTRTFTIKTVTLDGVEAPAITVVDTASGTVEVDPKNSAWIDTASQVLAASYAAASGSSAPASSGGGTTVVTDTSTPTVVTPEQALADQATDTVDEALAPAPEVMTVSTDAAQAAGEEGFFSKYKWWLIGGAAIVAYTQREAIMKMVKK